MTDVRERVARAIERILLNEGRFEKDDDEWLYNGDSNASLNPKMMADEALSAIGYEEIVGALTEALSVMSAETIGTYRMDDPDWYRDLDKAKASAIAALRKARGEP